MAGKHAGHRCKAKAKRLHPETIGSLSSHGSALGGAWSAASARVQTNLFSLVDDFVAVQGPDRETDRVHLRGARHATANIDRCAPQRLQRRAHALPDAPIHLLRNIQQDNCEDVPGENAR